MKAAALFLLLASLMPFGALAQSRPDLAQVASQVVELANEFRQAQGLAPLRRDPTLEASARRFAEFMAKTAKYGHEADGSTPAARAQKAGYRHCAVFENISYQYSSEGFRTRELARRLVEGWMKSPGHRKNMLVPHAVHTAVALARGANGDYYAVQLFARPESEGVAFRVSNDAGAAVTYRVGDEQFTLPRGTIHTHTRCAPETLALESGRNGKGKGTTLTTRNGDRYAVVREGGYLSLRR